LNPHEHSDEAYERLARHLSGEDTPADRADLELWLAEPGREDLRDQLEQDWQVVGLDKGWDVDAGMARLKQRIAAEVAEAPRVIRMPQKRLWWRTSGGLLKAAAVGIVLVGTGLVLSRARHDHSAPATEAAADLEVATRVGERRTIDLRDGSQIVLGPASSVTSRIGASGPREVELTGEAFFRVTHDEQRPFVVRTATAVIEDLGTEFSVRALGDATPVQVVVASGSVAVRRAGQQVGPDVVLQPRDVAILPDSGDVVVSHDVDVEAFQAWTTGRLVFRNAAFAEAIVELERWYDVDFRIDDSRLLQQHLNVEFSGQPIDEVLSIVGRILDVRLVRRGQIVELAPTERTGMLGSAAAFVGGGA
jgi:ferric-dicitrate binding protein FerR (iron transport regulator)